MLAIKTLPQLSLFLQDLQLQPLHSISQGLLALPHSLGAQLILAPQLSALAPRGGRRRRAASIARPVVRLREAALLQLRARFEGLDATLLALGLGVRAGQQQRDEGGDLVAQGRLGGSEGGLRDEFVVL